MKPEKPDKQDKIYKWIALGVVVIGTFMVILDSSIINVAIPKMMTVFGSSVADTRWIITAYALTMGATIPLTGYMSNRFGNKKVYIVSMAFFTLGSLLCGLAWSNSSMIVFRILQAVGGGLMSPISMSIIYDVFEREERGLALGFWGIAAMAAPTLGPTLGGYIIEYLNWRIIFTINVPIGIIGVLLAWIILKPSGPTTPRKFDPIGFATSTIGLVSCLYVLGEGSNIDWGDIKNVILMTLGVFSLIMFVINEWYHPEPMLDIRVLKNRPFALSMLINITLNMAMFGLVFVMPLYLQTLRGLTAMQTGMLLLPSALATGFVMPIGGKLYDKLGARPLVVPGLIIMAAATWQLRNLNMQTSLTFIMVVMIVRGLSMGLTMMPVTTDGMNAVPAHKVGEASALNNTIRQISSSLSITILTTVMTNVQFESYARQLEQVNPFNYGTTTFLQSATGYFAANGSSATESASTAQSLLMGSIQQQSFVDGIHATLVISTLIALITIPMALMMQDHRKKKDPAHTGQPIETDLEDGYAAAILE